MTEATATTVNVKMVALEQIAMQVLRDPSENRPIFAEGPFSPHSPASFEPGPGLLPLCAAEEIGALAHNDPSDADLAAEKICKIKSAGRADFPRLELRGRAPGPSNRQAVEVFYTTHKDPGAWWPEVKAYRLHTFVDDQDMHEWWSRNSLGGPWGRGEVRVTRPKYDEWADIARDPRTFEIVDHDRFGPTVIYKHVNGVWYCQPAEGMRFVVWHPDRDNAEVVLITCWPHSDEDWRGFGSEVAAKRFFVKWLTRHPQVAVTGEASREALHDAGIHHWSTLWHQVDQLS